MLKLITIKQEKEALSLTSLSTWLRRDKRTLMPDTKTNTTRASSRTSHMTFTHRCPTVLLKTSKTITANTTRAPTSKTKRATTTKNNMTRTKNHIIIKMASTLTTNRATNSTMMSNMMDNTNKMDMMINITKRVVELMQI